MSNLDTAQFLIRIIIFTLAYIISITLGGCLRAWVAKKMGDHTAEDLGYLSLNPWVHFDLFGYSLLILFGIGRGAYIPINWMNITGPHSTIKRGIAFFSDTFAHLLIASSSLMLMIVLFGKRGVLLSQSINLPLQSSSLPLVIGLIMSGIIYMNIMLAVISFASNFLTICLALVSKSSEDYSLWMLGAPILFVMIVMPMILGGWFTFIVGHIGTFLAHLVGA